MADVTVRAKWRGQRPDGTWAQEGDVFTVPADKVSSRWMEEIEETGRAKRPAGRKKAGTKPVEQAPE
jgi:hypothetical protein